MGLVSLLFGDSKERFEAFRRMARKGKYSDEIYELLKDDEFGKRLSMAIVSSNGVFEYQGITYRFKKYEGV